MVFVDSNVLVYVHDVAEPMKRRQAREWVGYLWRSRSGRLSYQVLQEFYVIATQKLRPGLDRAVARQDVEDLLAWNPIVTGPEILARAWQVQDRFQTSWWDAMIVAAAQAAECPYLLTEDLQHGQELDGVRVVSPFEEDPRTLLEGGWIAEPTAAR